MNALVRLYDTTRAQARELSPWRLRLATRRARRALSRDPLDQRHQVRLVAFEQELRDRGIPLAAGPTLPRRPKQPRQRYR